MSIKHVSSIIRANMDKTEYAFTTTGYKLASETAKKYTIIDGKRCVPETYQWSLESLDSTFTLKLKGKICLKISLNYDTVVKCQMIQKHPGAVEAISTVINSCALETRKMLESREITPVLVLISYVIQLAKVDLQKAITKVASVAPIDQKLWRQNYDSLSAVYPTFFPYELREGLPEVKPVELPVVEPIVETVTSVVETPIEQVKPLEQVKFELEDCWLIDTPTIEPTVKPVVKTQVAKKPSKKATKKVAQ